MTPAGITPFTRLEKVTLGHLLILLLGASWIFGGNIWWMRDALSVWGSLAAFITLAAFFQSGGRGREARRRGWWLLPWFLFILLVVASAFNPSFRPLIAEGEQVLVHFGAQSEVWPSTVEPVKSLRELWFYATVYLSAFNLLLVPRSRRFLRILLVAGATSCLLLAIFGTFQKLVAADIYFGAARSPNPRFFATFIYYNHWGAFMILWLSTAAGLVFYHANRFRGRDLWHSPFSLGVCGLLLIAVTAPVSASRAATGMAGIVLAAVTAHALVRIIANRRTARRPVGPPVVALLILILAATAAVGWLAERSIHERFRETRQALEGNQSLLGARAELYRDTWELAMRKPVFGWGFESYGSAFALIRPRGVGLYDQHENSFTEAHSDWLQSVAETGFVGTTLAILCGLIPLLATGRKIFRSPLSAYPLFGCGLVALYAWFEFPLANGAVLIAFWILFFGALRYARLESQLEPPSAP
jgi:O-antigen ligase